MEKAREMTEETKALMAAAHDARMKYRHGAMTREQAYPIAKRYIDHCNIGARRIAKEFGTSPRLMSVASFMR